MVRGALFGLFMLAAPAAAQTPDWLSAGGGLFPGAGEAVPAPGADPGPPQAAAAQPFDAIVREIAAAHGLDPKLLHAVLIVESAYDPRAVSPAGARGLAQLMPGTAADLGVRDPFDPAENVRGGGQYLATMLSRYRDVRLALAAYNAGPGRVDRTRGVPAIPETQAYVRDVVECFLTLTAGRAARRVQECRASGGAAESGPSVETASADTLRTASLFFAKPEGAQE
jgi:soluble lytic murein transglycosylase-like protein